MGEIPALEEQRLPRRFGERLCRAAADPEFKEVYESYRSFREQYANWREVAYLKE